MKDSLFGGNNLQSLDSVQKRRFGNPTRCAADSGPWNVLRGNPRGRNPRLYKKMSKDLAKNWNEKLKGSLVSDERPCLRNASRAYKSCRARLGMVASNEPTVARKRRKRGRLVLVPVSISEQDATAVDGEGTFAVIKLLKLLSNWLTKHKRWDALVDGFETGAFLAGDEPAPWEPWKADIYIINATICLCFWWCTTTHLCSSTRVVSGMVLMLLMLGSYWLTLVPVRCLVCGRFCTYSYW